MKLGGFLLLVTLFALSFEVQELQAAVRPLQLLGACAELCSGDWDCEFHERCVSNGCGHICSERMYYLFSLPTILVVLIILLVPYVWLLILRSDKGSSFSVPGVPICKDVTEDP